MAQIVSADRLRCGQDPLNKFWYLMRTENSKKCEAYGIPDDVYNLLMEYNQTEPIRVRIFAQVGSGTFNFELLQSISSVNL